jgi:predicted PurR-regulated permease PerM
MKSHDEPGVTPPHQLPLVALLWVVSLALGWILLPFYGTILWAVVIAMLFAPLYRRLQVQLRMRRTPAALLTLLCALVMVVLPVGLVFIALMQEAATLFTRLQSGQLDPTQYFKQVFYALPDWVYSVFKRFGMVDFDSLQKRASAGLTQGSQYLATQAFGIGQVTFEWVASVFITLYLSFFMIRDGDAIARALRRAIPLAPTHTRELLQKFTTVIRATVKGNLLVAAIQGALGGLAFWYLDLTAALLWAVLMAFLSLLPAVGAGLVWLPVALTLMAQGNVGQGLALVAWGLLVIGLVDNLLRPMLVGKDTRLPDYLVMISTLGGMAVFGINGFLIGPAVAAMFMAVWHIQLVEPAHTPPP